MASGKSVFRVQPAAGSATAEVCLQESAQIKLHANIQLVEDRTAWGPGPHPLIHYHP